MIHLATHGLFRPEEAAFSSVLLADGWVGMHDLYGLRLSADLVCLSACQTGRSWLDSGEEMVSLVRGLFHAGASAVLVSLWPVDDDSTAELMAAFYRRARAGTALDEALADATREVRQSRQHPFYWAPFVLIGNPD